MASDHFAHVKLSCSSLFTSGLVFLMIVALCNFSRLRQAFDKMSHPHLLGKLQQYRIKGQLLKWISDFLTTRRRRVVNRWPFLRLVEVTPAVPQGSILRPLLFLVYINELPLAVKCNCGLFAGDSILHRKVTSEPDWKDHQTSLHSAYHWRNTWLATLKSEKSKVLLLSRSKDP